MKIYLTCVALSIVGLFLFGCTPKENTHKYDSINNYDEDFTGDNLKFENLHIELENRNLQFIMKGTFSDSLKQKILNTKNKMYYYFIKSEEKGVSDINIFISKPVPIELKTSELNNKFELTQTLKIENGMIDSEILKALEPNNYKLVILDETMKPAVIIMGLEI